MGVTSTQGFAFKLIANGTQLEHQLVAIECAKAISQIFPLTTDLI